MAKRVDPKLLVALAELAGEHANAVLMGLRQSLAPSWILVGADNRTHVIATPWQDDADKERIALKMRRKIKEHHIVAYSFVAEAWTHTAPAGWQDNPNYVRPADDPKRQECVIAMATDGTHYEWRNWAIKRNHLEVITALEARHDLGGRPEGWTANLLAPA
jgi:hypothetical protein